MKVSQHYNPAEFRPWLAAPSHKCHSLHHGGRIYKWNCREWEIETKWESMMPLIRNKLPPFISQPITNCCLSHTLHSGVHTLKEISEKYETYYTSKVKLFHNTTLYTLNSYTSSSAFQRTLFQEKGTHSDLIHQCHLCSLPASGSSYGIMGIWGCSAPHKIRPYLSQVLHLVDCC